MVDMVDVAYVLVRAMGAVDRLLDSSGHIERGRVEIARTV